jgi:hypothetical protein
MRHSDCTECSDQAQRAYSQHADGSAEGAENARGQISEKQGGRLTRLVASSIIAGYNPLPSFHHTSHFKDRYPTLIILANERSILPPRAIASLTLVDDEGKSGIEH